MRSAKDVFQDAAMAVAQGYAKHFESLTILTPEGPSVQHMVGIPFAHREGVTPP